MGLQLGSSLGCLYKRGVGDGVRGIPRFSASRRRPTPSLVASRRPSSLESRRFLLVRVDTSEVLHLEHKTNRTRTPRWTCCAWSSRRSTRVGRDGREQLYGTATTRKTTSSRFRCNCASSGNPVIYNSQYFLVCGVENFVLRLA